jgi:uncharacterized protein (TIGR03435 family)
MSEVALRRCIAAILAIGAPVGHLTAATERHVSVPAFDSVEIRVSPMNTIPQMRTILSGDRYELRNATLLDLIRTAWGVSAEGVLGGPEWIDGDRFDVITRTSLGPNPQLLTAMLRGLLRDRFGLATHSRTESESAYIISVGARAQLRPGNGSAVSGCELKQNISTAPGVARPPVTLVCENESLGALAQVVADLREASGYVFDYPILDQTGLAGAWSFSLTWTPRNALHADPIAQDGTTIFDAFDHQLGLKLSLTSVSTSVVVVDSVRKPRVPKSPDPRMRFETAHIGPGDTKDSALQCGHIDIQHGGQVHINMTLRSLILESQGDFNPHRIIDPSNSLDKTCWEVLAKVPVQPDAPIGLNGPAWNGVDINSLRMMLRSLLEERFRLATHTEQRTTSGYALVASIPKLRRADLSSRPGCKEGLGGDEYGRNRPDPLSMRRRLPEDTTLPSTSVRALGFTLPVLRKSPVTGLDWDRISSSPSRRHCRRNSGSSCVRERCPNLCSWSTTSTTSPAAKTRSASAAASMRSNQQTCI